MIPLEINVNLTGEDITSLACIIMCCIVVVAIIRQM